MTQATRYTYDVEAHPRRWVILGVLCTSLLMVVLDNTVLNIAIPSLSEDLHTSTAGVQWIIDAYSLVFGGLLLTLGGLSDRFGRKRGFVTGLGVFGAASLACAFAPSTGWLIAARAVLGVGGAFLMPGTLSILINVFPARERVQAMSIWSGMSAIGMAAGPIVGGALVEHFWWGSVFLVNVPIVVVAVFAAVRLLPESRDPGAGRADIVGAILSTVAMTSLVYAVISGPGHGWTSAHVVLALLLTVASALAFAAWERRTPYPLLDYAILRQKRFVGAAVAGTLLLFTFGGASFIVTQILQLVLGFSPLQAGIRLLPLVLAVVVSAVVSAPLSARLGGRPVVFAGLLLVAAGLAFYGVLHGAGYLSLLVTFVGVGLGAGLALAPASEALLGAIPVERAGLGSALSDMSQEIGIALGVALLGALVATGYRSRLPADAPTVARESLAGAVGLHDPQLTAAARAAFEHGAALATLVAAAIAVGAALLSVSLLPRDLGRASAGTLDA
jgi:EmrB/QacA subfamily drug resistance transporter